MNLKSVFNRRSWIYLIDVVLIGLFANEIVQGIRTFGWMALFYVLLGMFIMIVMLFTATRYARQMLESEYEDAVDAASLDRECDCPPVPMEKVFAELDEMDKLEFDPSGRHRI